MKATTRISILEPGSSDEVTLSIKCTDLTEKQAKDLAQKLPSLLAKATGQKLLIDDSGKAS